MRKFAFAVLAVAAALFCPDPSRAQGKFEAFAGYTFTREKTTLPESDGDVDRSVNLNGYTFSGTYKVIPWLGATAEFSGGFGNTRSVSAHQQTYLFGPRVALPGPVSPFAHVLIGVAHQSNGAGIDSSNGGLIFSNSANAFATKFGFGMDLKVLPFISLRPIEVDYLATRFRGSTQNQPQISAGVVLHF